MSKYPVVVIGVGGVTCGGKTTISNKLKSSISNANVDVSIVNQDQFFIVDNPTQYLPDIKHWNFDFPGAIDQNAFVELVQKTVETSKSNTKAQLIIVDGHMTFCYDQIINLLDHCFFFDLSFEACKAIRDTRNYEPPDVPGYFEKYVFPFYLKHKAEVIERSDFNDRFTLLEAEQREKTYQTVFKYCCDQLSIDCCALTFEPICVEQCSTFVSHPTSGAISIFIGTTRDSFESKKVITLEYEAYNDMAIKEMYSLCNYVRNLYPDITKIAIFHRLGQVKVEEASVVIAISSPHRKEALHAVEAAIDRLKQSVPIWKKELYEDGSSNWKRNQNVDSQN